MVEEKAIFSIEKFLISRRLMYWQVYLHKTVVSAEMSVVLIFKRVLELLQKGVSVQAASTDLDFFLQNREAGAAIKQHLDRFCRLDDHDVMASIKNWCHREKASQDPFFKRADRRFATDRAAKRNRPSSDDQ
jgi:HD superfamily phosphohydrolase